MAAQNIGAGRWDRIDRLAGVGVAINVVMTGMLVVAMLLSGHFLLGLFLPATSPAIAIGDHINWLIGWTFIPMGISMVMTSIVRANGAVLVPLLILVFSVIVVRMTVGFTLHPVHGADAIWWSFMASGTASALMASVGPSVVRGAAVILSATGGKVGPIVSGSDLDPLTGLPLLVLGLGSPTHLLTP